MLGRACVVYFAFGFLTAPVAAQSLDQQERLNTFDKALQAIEDARAASNRLADSKKQQCVAAVALEQLCQCLSEKLPFAVNFPAYAALVSLTKEALQYDELSAQDKKVVDLVRLARDQCVKAKR